IRRKMLKSRANLARASGALTGDMHPLTQCLPLELITLSNQKYTHSGELRRVLGIPLGNSSEELSSSGVARSKPSPSVATEELKHFKDNVLDASRRARDRVRMFRQSILKLDKYRETQGQKKRQKFDSSCAERPNLANPSKMGSQSHCSINDNGIQRLEDRTKSVGLHKRARTSVADLRGDSRMGSVPRPQIGSRKDRDKLVAASGDLVQREEKIRRLPPGGDGWERKIKRKRSVGTVINRLMDSDRHANQSVHPKSQSGDPHGFRSASSPGVSGINKLDCSFESTKSNLCMAARNDPDNATSLTDGTPAMDERNAAKMNNRTNICEHKQACSLSTWAKVKLSRVPRTGSLMVMDSSPDAHVASEPFESSVQPRDENKASSIDVANNLRVPLSVGPSSHPMAKWVGQRQYKTSRARRTNIVSPVSNHDESQSLSQGLGSSGFTARVPSNVMNDSLIASSFRINSPQVKLKVENVSSPFAFSESEDSGAGENKLKEKVKENSDTAVKASHIILRTKKSKLYIKEIGDGLQRQGKTGRGPFLSRPGIQQMEKLENLPAAKPVQRMKGGSDKSKSKSGRPPSKKIKDRKAYIRTGQVSNGGSSDFTGDSDDDREELLAAAKFAHSASYFECSGPFWKKMYPTFASLGLEDKAFLEQELSFAEQLDEILSQIFGNEYDILGTVLHKEALPLYGEIQESCSSRRSSKDDALSVRHDKRTVRTKIPLYQRLLSALIEEDETEELHPNSEGKNPTVQCASDDSHSGSCNYVDLGDKLESEIESEVEFHTQWQEDDSLSNSSVSPSGVFQNEHDGPQRIPITVCRNSSFECQYQLMCFEDKLLLELESIGLYPGTMPDLAEEEDLIDKGIVDLKEGLFQQAGQKRRTLEQIKKTIETGKENDRRKMEQIAMDQLVETAYKKRMACRGGNSSKNVVRKVPKPVAMAFLKRTLARCQKFEETGNSCFSEPPLLDVIFSAPSSDTGGKSVGNEGSGTGSNAYNDARNLPSDARLTALIIFVSFEATGVGLCSLQRHDSPSDNVDIGSSDTLIHSTDHSILTQEPMSVKGRKRELLLDDVGVGAAIRVGNSLGGTKGQRGERERDQEGLTSASASRPGAGRSSVGSRSERKSKVKPTQKATYLSSSGGENKLSKEVPLPSAGNLGTEKNDVANLQLPDLDQLAMPNDLEPQDLSTLFNFDEDGLQEDDCIGLDIPMDDLSELNMLM
ncbi:hypothetical protein RJ641_033240, partial [Dillenia turbinata]